MDTDLLTERFIAAAAITALVTWACIAWLRPVARRIGLLDCPDARKRHNGRVPLIGGLCFFVGTIAGLLYLGESSPFVAALLGLGTVILLTGLIDDLRGLSVRARLMVQAAAALLMIGACGLYVDDAGDLFGHGVVSIGLIGLPFTVLAVVGLVNAFNMLDGIDGLAATQTLVTILALLLFAGGGSPALLTMLQLLAVALLPFLLANLGWPDGRRIFMGDAGSTLLGFTLAWSLVGLSQLPSAPLSPADVLWCVALPVIETLTVMYRRMANGRSPFAADRRHLHHRLLDAGFAPRQVLVLIMLASAVLAMAGYGLRALPDIYSLTGFATVLVLYAVWIPRALRIRPASEALEPAARANAGAMALAAPHAISPSARTGSRSGRRRNGTSAHRQRGAIGVRPTPPQPAQGVQGGVAVKTLCVLDGPDGAGLHERDSMLAVVRRLIADVRFDVQVYTTGRPTMAGATGLESPAMHAAVGSDAAPTQALADNMLGESMLADSILAEIRRVIVGFQPDVVLVHGESNTALLTALVAACERVPVVRLAGAETPTGTGRCAAIIAQLASRNFAIDETVHQRLLSSGVPCDRIQIAPRPVSATSPSSSAEHAPPMAAQHIVDTLLRMRRGQAPDARHDPAAAGRLDSIQPISLDLN